MTRPPGGDEIFAFGERLLALLEEASYSTTYKLAVLLALIDLCMEHSRRDGSAPTTVTTRQLAEKVLELYWPQAVPFGARTGAVVLAQSNGGQAEILTAIVRFRDAHAPDAAASIARARRLAPGRLERLVREIEWKLVEMPLPRLQRVGREDDPFLYRIAWNERITRGEFDGPGFDNRILFIGSAGNHLVQLLGLLRPLVQRRWAGMVARLNPTLVEDSRLEEFLFGAERISLEPVRAPLRDLQEDRCFYCAGRLDARADVDHFLPWSRHPDNAIENLVVADPRCNRHKRDFFASSEHVERWARGRLVAGAPLAPRLSSMAAEIGWESHPERTFAVARSVYSRLRGEARLWVAAGRFEAPDPRRLRSLFEPDAAA